MGASDKGETGDQALPKSMRHKHILDVAAEKPEASLEGIADEVPSATADLVDQVLEEYGDPVSNGEDHEDIKGTEPAESEDEGTANDGEDDGGLRMGVPAHDEAHPLRRLSDLTERQRDVFRAIHDQPEATQRELGEVLDVSAATVSNRVNAIEGFEWGDRQAIVAAVCDASNAELEQETTTLEANESDETLSRAELHERVTTLDKHVTALATDSDTATGLDDPELVHKVLHACFDSDAITEEEELQLLHAILR